MAPDRSLTEFGSASPAERTTPESRVEITYRWDGTEPECDACGRATDRLWRADRSFVCPTCKDW